MPNHSTRRYTEEQVLDAIAQSRGIVSAVARKLGCSWPTADEYIKKFPAACAAMDSEREVLVDTAEATLASLLKSEDEKIKLNSAQFILERLGKKRGYCQKQEIDHTTKGESIRSISPHEFVRSSPPPPSKVDDENSD
jgi:hypothetical protein